MAVDIAALKRRYKPERRLIQLKNRSTEALPTAIPGLTVRRVLVDTTVYIHDAADRLPPEVISLLDQTMIYHSPVCIAEILSGLSQLHPASPAFEAAWDRYQRLFGAIQARRLLAPSAQTLCAAGILAGTLARTQNHAKAQSQKLFNDAAIYLTGAEHGLPVLTANGADFDLIQQAAGHGDFIVYAPD